MPIKMTLKSIPSHWKDRAAGWFTWRIEFDCVCCHQHRVEICCGTHDMVHSLYVHPVCEACLDLPDSTFECHRCHRKVNVRGNPHGADNWQMTTGGLVCDTCQPVMEGD